MGFDLQPTLSRSLVHLRPLREEDFNSLFAVASDPLVWEQHPSNDRYKEDVFRQFFRDAMSSGGALLATDAKDGRVIGSSRFHGYDEAAGEIEIGWTFLARSHWGGAYNGEMKQLMLRHAFRFVESVIFVVGARNLRSQYAVQRIGGVLAGTRTGADGEQYPVFRIVRPAARVLADMDGPYEARYLAFLEAIAELRPKLHRYCARMTGSVMDGEDVVQEALFQAYRKLETFDSARPLKPWLFRIAHNRCIDFLRRHNVRMEAEAAALAPDFVDADEPQEIGPAVEWQVSALPAKERACVLLKDVFDYSLDEIAELVESTTGGVKAALHRGRAKLATAAPLPINSRTPLPPILHLYVDRFNRRDWDGVRQLASADARIRVTDRFEGPLADAPYFARYERMPTPWRWTAGEVDGEPVIIALRERGGAWMPQSIARVQIVDGAISEVVDYLHCPWVLETAARIAVSSAA